MIINTAGQEFHVIAFDLDGRVTGDAANITCTLAIDGGSRVATNDVNPIEIGTTGEYVFYLTQAESNGHQLSFVPTSATGGVQVLGSPSNVIYTHEESTAGPGGNNVPILLKNDSAIPIAGSVVNAQDAAGNMLGYHVVTDAFGTATFKLATGNYKFAVSDRVGYLTHTAEPFAVPLVSSPAELTVTVAPVPTPASGLLCAVLFNVRLNDVPVVGAIVKARLRDANQVTEDTIASNAMVSDVTDANGQATLDLIREDQFTESTNGIYVLEVMHGEYQPWLIERSIPNLASVTIPAVLANV